MLSKPVMKLIKGKRTHDLRLMAVMKTGNLTHLLTFNPNDFIKILEIQIVHPHEIIQNKP